MFENMLQTFVAELQHSVLDDSLFVINRVEKVQKLNNVVFSAQHVENLKLTRDDVTCLLRSLESHLALSIVVISFENVT